MLKDNIQEVPEVPMLAERDGVEEVFLTNICHTINTWQEESEDIYPGREGQSVRQGGDEGGRQGKLNVKPQGPSSRITDVPVCERISQEISISRRRKVSLHVYLHPPLPSPSRIFCGCEYWVERLSFGNAFQVPFSEIWNKAPYVDFRSRFFERDKKSRELFLSLLDGAKPGAPQQEAFPESPDPCKSCHKILGL
jgi:MoaA/NifB/PqqE/SkfB family radical SAM enzyme